MTNGDPKKTKERIDSSGCTALLTVTVPILLSVFAPVFAVYGLISGQSMSIPSRNGSGDWHWYTRGKEPGGYWFAEALWLFFAVLSLAFWGYVLWSFRRPGKKPTAPSGEQIVPEPPDRGGDAAG